MKRQIKYQEVLDIKFYCNSLSKEITFKEFILEVLIFNISLDDYDLFELLKLKNLSIEDDKQLFYDCIKYIFNPNSFQYVIAWCNESGDIKSYKNKYIDDGFNIPIYTENLELFKG